MLELGRQGALSTGLILIVIVMAVFYIGRPIEFGADMISYAGDSIATNAALSAEVRAALLDV